MTFGIPKLDLTCLKRTRPFLSTHRAQISHLSDRSSHILHSQGVEEGVSNQKRERQTLTSPQKLKLQKVEQLGPESWSGVATPEKDSVTPETTLGKTAALASGDFAFLLLFAAIGRGSHGRALDVASVLTTAAPFLIGWFGAADLQKAFAEEAQGSNVSAAAKKAAIVWATGIPVGILVRSAQQGHFPNPAFVLVTLAFTFVTLVGWRTALAASSGGKGEPTKSSKRGNPFEFLQLLASLTTRW